MGYLGNFCSGGFAKYSWKHGCSETGFFTKIRVGVRRFGKKPGFLGSAIAN